MRLGLPQEYVDSREDREVCVALYLVCDEGPVGPPHYDVPAPAVSERRVESVELLCGHGTWTHTPAHLLPMRLSSSARILRASSL